MVTKRRKTTTIEEDRDEAPAAPAAAPAPDDPMAQSESESIGALFAELAGVSNSRVVVYRANRNQKQAYMFTCTPDQFSLDDLREKYNGGEFRLYVSKDGRPFKNILVNVEPKQVNAGEPAAPGMADVVIAMREGFAQQAELMREALLAREPAASPLGNMNLAELITAIGTLTKNNAPPPAPAPSSDTAITMLLKGIELARELRETSGGEGEPSLMGLFRDLIKSPMTAQALQAMAAQAATQPQPVVPARPVAPRIAPPVQPQPAPAPAPAVAQPTQGEPVNPMLKHYLGVLVKKAEEGADPALYADVALDNVPEETLRFLIDRPPTAVDALIADHPPIANHREWFNGFVASIREALDEGIGGQDGVINPPQEDGAASAA